jgi:hypothetical protein
LPRHADGFPSAATRIATAATIERLTSSAAKRRRYIERRYAQEVVLINFPHDLPADAMERLIELLLRTEDAL